MAAMKKDMKAEAPAAPKKARTANGKVDAGSQAAMDVNSRWFDYCFSGDKAHFDELWHQSWAELDEEMRCCRRTHAKQRKETTADSDNRKRDMAALEKRLGLKEDGDPHTMLYNKDGQVLATGFVQILYGDHGDYFELMEKNVNWTLFTEHKLKGPGRHYHEHYHKTSDGSIQIYDQFNTVADEPNPPPGAKSQANNRKEGYAPYSPGVFYMPTEAVERIERAAVL